MSALFWSDKDSRTRQKIFDNVDDLVTRFTWDDRKEDEDLPRGALEGAVRDGVIEIKEIVERFESELREALL